MLLGGIGFILMGLIPNEATDINMLHEITAGVGFGVSFLQIYSIPEYWDGDNDGKIDKKLHLISQLIWWF